MTSWSFLPAESCSLPALPAQCSDYLFIRLRLNSSLHIGYAELGHTPTAAGFPPPNDTSGTAQPECHRHKLLRWTLIERASPLTSSSLYQDRDSAVRTNQYSFEPPFMMLMLIVSQPFLITCKVGKKCGRHEELNRRRKEADGRRDMTSTICFTFV